MMKFTLRLLALFLVASIALPSCVSKKKFTELENQNSQLSSSLAESQNQVNQLNEKVTGLESEMASEKTRLNGEIAALGKKMDTAQSEASAAKASLSAKEAELAKIKKEIRMALGMDSGVAVMEKDGNLYVTMENPVNYSSGSSRLNREARKAVESLAASLKSNPNMRVVIEGHTDSQKFPSDAGMDNWQLSVNRAMAVVKRLIREGVNPDQLVVSGAGSTQPVAPNDTRDGRSENRRTVAKPAPNTGTLLNIGGGN